MKGKHRNIFTGGIVTVIGIETLPFGDDIEEFVNYEREDEQFTYDENRIDKNYIGKKFFKPTRIFNQCYIKVNDEGNS